MTLGDLELTPLLDGFLRLDGCPMFGVVPKPLWERRATFIIDAGIGAKMDPKSIDIYGIDRARSLDGSLATAGVSGDDVQVVRESIEREYVVFFEHDPEIAAGYIREKGGPYYVEQVTAEV